ncbi:MAG: hypothetical protein QXD11_01190 [Candidatus Micrarchaeaceae archaeon]
MLIYGSFIISILVISFVTLAFYITKEKEIKKKNRLNFSIVQFLELLNENKQIIPFKKRIKLSLKPDYPFEKDYLSIIKEYEVTSNFDIYKIGKYHSEILDEITWIISKGIKGVYVDKLLESLQKKVLKENEMRNRNYSSLSNLQFILTSANLAFIPAFAGISFVILKYGSINLNTLGIFPIVISLYLIESNSVISFYKKLLIKEKVYNIIIYSSISLAIFFIISKIAMLIV